MSPQQSVSLFIPCLVDQVYPEIGIAMVKLLRGLGVEISYNRDQTCCGQPAFNAGHHEDARRVAGRFLKCFQDAHKIVVPSGSCAAMVQNYYPGLFKGHDQEDAAVNIGDRLFEISRFLEHEDLIEKIEGRYEGIVGFHNSCHSLRELEITETPMRILNRISGCEIRQPRGEPVCCGFGGLFSFKHGHIAEAMAFSRLNQFTALGIDILISNDPGCIMHMRQEAIDRRINLPIMHLTEFLAKVMPRSRD